ncbi:hypothetical protein, partial [Chroococcidiopsis sp. CCALA 051]|uniref:hypothetical protein n=1 Tax=Chroococcidiopsis sp. CCALA 051 TaxID=869949 RepID=UPI001E65AC21
MGSAVWEVRGSDRSLCTPKAIAIVALVKIDDWTLRYNSIGINLGHTHVNTSDSFWRLAVDRKAIEPIECLLEQ